MIDFDFLNFFIQLHEQEGSIGQYTIYQKLSFLIKEPSLIRKVIENKEDNYTRPNHPYKQIADFFSSEGKFILKLPFENKNHSDLLEGIVENMKGAFFSFQDQLNREEVDFSAFSKQIFFTAIAKNIFGLDLSAYSLGFITAANVVEEYTANTSNFSPSNLPEEHREEFETALSEVNTVSSLILKKMNVSESENSHGAIFGTLMNGYNGIGVSLSWLLYRLAKDQKIQETLLHEMKGLPPLEEMKHKDLVGMKYLSATIMESLRYYPASWVLGRTARRAHSLGDVFIPEGANITVCTYTLHRDAKYWKNPNRFDPDRFLNKNTAVPYTYIPFGGGQNKCPAASFAHLFLKMATIGILQRCKVKTLKKEHPPIGLVSLRSEENILLKVEPRK